MSEYIYRVPVGDFKCTVVSDGVLTGGGQDPNEKFGLNCLLVEAKGRKILIDTGCGTLMPSPYSGKLPASLKEIGLTPTDIDTVIFTHGHIDHAAGSFNEDGSPVFPHARYITTQPEWDYMAAGPDDNRTQYEVFYHARKYLLPLKDRCTLVPDGYEVLPGFRLDMVPGHTPGFVTVDITSKGQRLFCIGDICHGTVEFTDEKRYTLFDVDPEQAVAARWRVLAELARSGVLVLAVHFLFPGLGYIRRQNGAYHWEPIKG